MSLITTLLDALAAPAAAEALDREIADLEGRLALARKLRSLLAAPVVSVPPPYCPEVIPAAPPPRPARPERPVPPLNFDDGEDAPEDDPLKGRKREPRPQAPRLSIDERHRQMAAYLAREGPRSVKEIARDLAWGIPTVYAVMAHHWFIREGGKVHLTNEGRQVVVLGYVPGEGLERPPTSGVGDEDEDEDE